MQYQQQTPGSTEAQLKRDGRVIVLPPMSTDLVVNDSLLEKVRSCWQTITGEDEEAFMQFPTREGIDIENDG